jgi:hypothetical protein
MVKQKTKGKESFLNPQEKLAMPKSMKMSEDEMNFLK